MGRKIVVILLLLVNYAQAQNRQTRKLEKLYTKQRYDKCIAKALDLHRKERHNPDAVYYLSLSYFGKYSDTPKTYLLKKSIAYLDDTRDLDTSYQGLNSPDVQSLHNVLTEKAAGDSTARLTVYAVNALANTFRDTLPRFYALNGLKPNNLTTIDTSTLLSGNRAMLMNVAERLIGVPYKYGGEDTTGFDCSGFVRYVYHQVGVNLPHNAHMISTLGEEIPMEDAQAGDIVLFGYRSGNGYRASHAGIVYREGDDFTVIHCVTGGVKVAGNDWDHHWSNQVLFVKRLLDE